MQVHIEEERTTFQHSEKKINEFPPPPYTFPPLIVISRQKKNAVQMPKIDTCYFSRAEPQVFKMR
jgi:hypothetical protein